MRHSFEVEIRETEGREPSLHGIVIQEGRAASQRREIFVPNSIKWPSDGIAVLTEHRGSSEVKAHPIRGADGKISITARATTAIRQAVEQGKRFMSLEFVSTEESITGGGIREIRSAMMLAAALVSAPEYTQSSAEVRSKRVRVWL